MIGLSEALPTTAERRRPELAYESKLNLGVLALALTSPFGMVTAGALESTSYLPHLSLPEAEAVNAPSESAGIGGYSPWTREALIGKVLINQNILLGRPVLDRTATSVVA